MERDGVARTWAGTRPAPTGLGAWKGTVSRVRGQAQGRPYRAGARGKGRCRAYVGRHKACPYRAGARGKGRCRAYVGRHKAGTQGDLMGLAGRGRARHGRLGTCYEYQDPVDEARHGLGGALRGRSPRTREGRIGPTAQMRGERGEERGESETVLGCLGLFQARPELKVQLSRGFAFVLWGRVLNCTGRRHWREWGVMKSGLLRLIFSLSGRRNR